MIPPLLSRELRPGLIRDEVPERAGLALELAGLVGPVGDATTLLVAVGLSVSQRRQQNDPGLPIEEVGSVLTAMFAVVDAMPRLKTVLLRWKCVAI